MYGSICGGSADNLQPSPFSSLSSSSLSSPLSYLTERAGVEFPRLSAWINVRVLRCNNAWQVQEVDGRMAPRLCVQRPCRRGMKHDLGERDAL